MSFSSTTNDTPKPLISVVMPTYNRADAIGLTLQHLAKQTLSPDLFEVIIIDDGSTDNTSEVVAVQELPFDIRYYPGPNRGAAAARNLGVSRALGDFILFLDCDIIPTPELLETHLVSHRTNDNVCVILGKVQSWTDSQLWGERVCNVYDVGHNYGDSIRTIAFYMAYTANMSVKRALIEKINGFDESFSSSGFEDVEFAYRASLEGALQIYQPSALAFHNHPLKLSQYLQKSAAYMRLAALLIKLHPEIRHLQIPGFDNYFPPLASPLTLRALKRRVWVWVLSLWPVRKMLFTMVSFLEQHQWGPRLIGILYWRALAAHKAWGFRQGMRQYGLRF